MSDTVKSTAAIASANGGKKRSMMDRDGCDSDIRLPGGYARAVDLPEQKEDVARQFRAYLDVLFNSAIVEAMRAKEVVSAIPTIVRNILAYNNILFRHVEMRKTTCDRIVEPLWFSYSVNENRLTLYLHYERYQEYVVQRTNVPVIWPDGSLRVDRYNPHSVPGSMSSMIIEPSIVMCAVVCDHVAQHIIHSIFNEERKRGGNDQATLHENWTRHGTTLHSMLSLEISFNENNRGQCSSQRFMAMISLAGNNSGGAGGNDGAGRSSYDNINVYNSTVRQ